MAANRWQGEPETVRARRAEAAARATGQALPDRAQHRWRYTDPALLLPEGRIDAALVEAAGPGAGVEVELPPEAAARGAGAWTLDAAPAAALAEAAEHAGRIAGWDDPILALGLAAFASGAIVVVPAGVTIEAPIRVRHRVRDLSPERLAVTRTLIVAGPGASATVVEELDVASGRALAVSEARVAADARLEHVRVESVAAGATAFAHAAADVDRDGSLVHGHVLRADGLLKSESSPRLSGRGARSEGLVVVRVAGRGRADFRVREAHAGEDTTSRVTWRAVARERGEAVFTGLLRIEERAVRAEAYEEARALLLSRTARAEVIPELEILNHDVRCSHGAAVAPVDEEALYYLQTRGLPRSEAEALLVEGFLEPVLARLASRLPEGVA